MLKHLKNFLAKYKKGLKLTYALIIVAIVLESIYDIYQKTSLKSIEKAFSLLSPAKIILLVVIGALAVVPMAIYDFIYTQKTKEPVGIVELLKNSYIINTLANAGGSGGVVGASLRVYLFGKASHKMVETIKVVSQIALFTLMGLVTNDLLAILLNWHDFGAQPFSIRIACLLYPLYIFVPFIIPTKTLKLKDYGWLLVGSSLEWLAALGFFVLVGLVMGLPIDPLHIYLAVAFAGICGAISMIPGGIGTFDAAIILSLGQFGVSTGTAVTWAFIYRICYYIIPFLLGLIFLLITFIHRKLKN